VILDPKCESEGNSKLRLVYLIRNT
jgi:hypothetical protein